MAKKLRAARSLFAGGGGVPFCPIFSMLWIFFMAGDRYLGDSATDDREILHDDTLLLPFLGALPTGAPHNQNFGPVKCEVTQCI